MGAKSRRKGAAFERRVARMLSEATGCTWERNLEEVRSGNSGDLVQTSGEPLAYTFQVKCGLNPSVWRAHREASEAARPAQIPVAVVHRNQAKGRAPQTVAVLSLEDFLELIGRAEAA